MYLEYTISLVLKEIYKSHDISRLIKTDELKETILSCLKYVHFKFNDVVSLITKKVDVGLPMVLVLHWMAYLLVML